MLPAEHELELRKITIASLMTCVYLPAIVTIVSYKGLLYTVGNASSCYVLVLIFIAELLKSYYLNISNNLHIKRSRSRVGDIVKSFLFLLGVTFSFFYGVILFGAPFLDSHEQTMMLSALLTLLTMFPLVAHSGYSAAMQLLFGVKSYSKNTMTQMFVNNALFTVCGAWLGAVVIPLDWNTPWQVWPIPCYLGALGGFLISNLLTVTKVILMSAANNYPAMNFIINIIDKVHINSK